MTDKYEDIINLPHHVSQNHPHMSMINRAAQFSSFAALSGYDEAVRQTTHIVEDMDIKDEYSEDEGFEGTENDF